MIDANSAKVSSMHFAGWNLGLKTGMYYLRTKAATDAIQFTVQSKSVPEDATIKGLAERSETSELDADTMAEIACSLDNPDECLSCGA